MDLKFVLLILFTIFTKPTDFAKAEVENQLEICNSCGNITNIHYPFSLLGCWHGHEHGPVQLSCDRFNRTVLYVRSMKFYVRGIHYTSQDPQSGFSVGTFWLVDSSLLDDEDGDTCRVPSTSRYWSGYRYTSCGDWSARFSLSGLVLMNCTEPVSNYSGSQVNLTSCYGSSSSLGYYFYALNTTVANSPMDLDESCVVQATIPVMYPKERSNFPVPEMVQTGHTSGLDVHKWLLNGFEADWSVAQGCDSKSNTTLDKLFNYYKNSLLPNTYELVSFWTFTGWFIARTFLGIFLLITMILYKRWRAQLSLNASIEEFLNSHHNLIPIKYSHSEIKKMTQNFKHKLGQGGFGSVYKGKLRSGDLVAVKVLVNNPKTNGQDFINEVATIGRIHHVNVVRLVGFCIDGAGRALVYDFMPNGSMDRVLFQGREGGGGGGGEGEAKEVTWLKMHEIALGVARGIEYLHRGCEMQILHFDIKPHNILLDRDFVPKVSDFGLAKLYPADGSLVSLTAIRGTLGYMAPELFYKNVGGVSYKADVYSFGMLLMEMVGRRKNSRAFVDQSSVIYFPTWIYENFDRYNEVLELEEASEKEREIVKKMVMVAFWCIQMNPIRRPSMSKVLEMLEGDVEKLEMPPEPCMHPGDMSLVSLDNAQADTHVFKSSSSCNPSDTISIEFDGR